MNNLELQKYFDKLKNKFDQILSHVSEEDNCDEPDIVVDDIGDKSISIND